MRHPLPALLLLVLAACQTQGTPKGLYQKMLVDTGTADGANPLDPGPRKDMAERYATITRWNAEGRLKTGEDYFYAAGVLVRSDVLADLALAEAMGRVAVEQGETRANVFVAEAIDRTFMLQDLPQHYGTQIVWVPVLRGWRLYPVDAATTDAQRAAMGIPPLAELESYVEIQNQSEFTRRIRGE